MIRVETPQPAGIAARALATMGHATGLDRYEAACRAVAAAKCVDEAKEIRNQSEAMRAYAKQAENKQLETDAAEIRLRATRRIGELMAAQRDADMMHEGGRPITGVNSTPVSYDAPITLSEAGIGKNLAKEARALAAIPATEFDGIVQSWRERIEIENERVTVNLLKAGEEANARRENDFYPTPQSLIAEIALRWKPKANAIWEPCVGDGRVAQALRGAGHEVVTGDIATGEDFFARSEPPTPGIALCTNPPFGRLREFIDHAFAIGITDMCLVLPERVWASRIGREQFERHRPRSWANMDWREDYLGKGGSPDRALAVAIWDSSCSDACGFDVWTRQAVAA